MTPSDIAEYLCLDDLENYHPAQYDISELEEKGTRLTNSIEAVNWNQQHCDQEILQSHISDIKEDLDVVEDMRSTIRDLDAWVNVLENVLTDWQSYVKENLSEEARTAINKAIAVRVLKGQSR